MGLAILLTIGGATMGSSILDKVLISEQPSKFKKLIDVLIPIGLLPVILKSTLEVAKQLNNL